MVKVTPQPLGGVATHRPEAQSAFVVQFDGVQTPTGSPHRQMDPAPHSASWMQPYTH
jgi:hypothetical protein